MLVNGLGHLGADARHGSKIPDPRAQYALQSAESLEQFAPSSRSEPRDLFQHGGLAGLGAAGAMTGYREPVGLVAHTLNDVQRA